MLIREKNISKEMIEKFKKIFTREEHSSEYLNIAFKINHRTTKKILKGNEYRTTKKIYEKIMEYINAEEYPQIGFFDLKDIDLEEIFENERKQIKYNKAPKLEIGSRYSIMIEDNTIACTIYEEYEHFYVAKEDTKISTTILKNNLVLETTKIQKID